MGQTGGSGHDAIIGVAQPDVLLRTIIELTATDLCLEVIAKIPQPVERGTHR